MDDVSRRILEKTGLCKATHIDIDKDIYESDYTLSPMVGLDDLFIPRELLLSESKYIDMKDDIVELKKKLSSSALTSLQKTATSSQKWPLLNLIRQILHVYGYNMKPIRKSDGYTKDGVKKFKRFFHITNTNILV